jgi:NADH-quinone oxidoreductase subunit H
MQTALNLLEAEPIRLFISFGAVLFLVLNLAGILTMAERKTAAYIQLRYGPNRVGPRGLLQPAADVVKLFTKENVSPGRSDLWVFSPRR